MNDMTKPCYQVGILIFDEVEVLDFAGPFEVFSVTAELQYNQYFNVHTISATGDMICAKNGLKVLPDRSFSTHPPLDILILAGGDGTKAAICDPETLSWVNNVHQNTLMTLSICSGARFLAKLGLLDHAQAVTHQDVITDIETLAPTVTIQPDQRFVTHGKISTSGGITAGIDLSLHIVKTLCGEKIRQETVKYMEYGDWRSY